MEQQTALDYYSKQIGKLTADLVTGRITGKQFVMLQIKLLEEAKEMEKEQIMKAHISAGARLEDISIQAAEHYYNETYEGGKK
jgi:hypothetical protein